MVCPVTGSVTEMVTVPSRMQTSTVHWSMIFTQPQVPRIPTTMVEVRMFRDSPSSRGSVTLKKMLPSFNRSSSCFPLLRISTSLRASSLLSLVLSRSIQA